MRVRRSPSCGATCAVFCRMHSLTATTPAAGAWATSRTLEEARRRGLDPEAFLDRNDSHPFFERLGQTLVTGPTQVNVMDVHVLLRDEA